MKTNKKLLIVLMVVISFLAIGAVSASDSDNMTDTMELSVVDDEVQTVETDENQDMNEVLSDGEGNADDVEMAVKVENITYGDRISINVTVNDTTKTVNFSQSGVEIEIDGKYITKAPISSEGQSGGSFNLTLDVGTHYVKTTLINGTDRIVTNGTIFSVTKDTPVVNVENITAIIGQGVKVVVNVTDRRGNNLSGYAIVTIFIEGNSISKFVKIVNGTAESSFEMSDMMGMMGGMDWGSMFGNGSDQNSSKMEFNMSDMKNMMNGSGGMGPFASMGSSAVKFSYYFPVGTYNVSAIFLPSRNYKEAANTTTLTVVYADDIEFQADITAPKNVGDKTIVDIRAFDKYGNPMPNIKVTAVVDDSKEASATLDGNASAQVTFDNLVNGAHKLVISSNATGNITNKTFDFTLALPKTDVAITANDMSVVTVNSELDGKIGEYYTITLKDSLGNVLSGKKVQVSIDNVKYDLTADENGIAKLQLNIAKAGTYTCAIAFLGDDAYNGAFTIAKVTVNKQTAKLTTKNAAYKAKAKTKKLTATFKSAKGNAIKSKKITFKVNGKTYAAKTNAKGVATVKVKLTKKGKYTFTAKFAGDDTYKALSKKGKLTIK